MGRARWEEAPEPCLLLSSPSVVHSLECSHLCPPPSCRKAADSRAVGEGKAVPCVGPGTPGGKNRWDLWRVTRAGLVPVPTPRLPLANTSACCQEAGEGEAGEGVSQR